MFRTIWIALGLCSVIGLLPQDAVGQSVAQQAYLKASNTDATDFFGPVAISGDTIVVGAIGESSTATGVNGNQNSNAATNSGAAYIFVRNGSSWTQQAYLKASNSEALDKFGSSVAISGDTVVVGARAEDSRATGANGNQTDNSVPRSGAAYVFVRNGTSWSQQAYLKASNTGADDDFGSSVALSGDTLVVGAHREDSSAQGVNGAQADDSAPSAGAAYVFVRDGTSWSQQAYLKASNSEILDGFGLNLALSGDTLAVGASSEDSSATGVDGDQADNGAPRSGAVYVFERSGTTWTQEAYIKASNAGINDLFSVPALSGDTLVVGAGGEASSATGVDGDQADNSSTNAGAVYVFVRSGSSWSQQAYLKASNTQASDFFGTVAISGDTLAVGAGNEESNATGVDGDQSDNSLTDAGAVYLFTRNGTTWSQQAYLKASNTGQIDRFGRVSMSGDTLVVGAGSEDSAAEGVNGNQASNGAFQSGAAYVYQVAPAECFLVIGDGPGSSPFSAAEHLFQTQVGPTVEDAYPVLMEAIPSFVLPGGGGGLPTKTRAVSGPGLLSLRGAPPLPDASPSWMLDGQFAVQVLMWNPMVFPGQPEQFSAGLLVSVLPDGTVLSAPYGQSVGGLEIWHEIGTNAQGESVIRFPFSIPGL